MNINEIKFIANKEYINFTEIKPEPSKLNIPNWYIELKHSLGKPTVKGCIPFLETLTSGYILKMPIDYFLSHNVKKIIDKKMHRYTNGYSGTSTDTTNNFFSKNVNLNSKKIEYHPIEQLGKTCPYVNKNKDLPFHKILNPWIIKTPPGYSCLFLPPMNNTDDRFSIIPGIVDTDTFPSEINFPIVINGDKYPVLETTIKMGTPYVQIIPFKREKWKMKIEAGDNMDKHKGTFLHSLKNLHIYKTLWWNKKSWK
jgi:hypothetical protein